MAPSSAGVFAQRVQWIACVNVRLAVCVVGCEFRNVRSWQEVFFSLTEHLMVIESRKCSDLVEGVFVSRSK